MYKVICPKCETIQLYPDDGIRGLILFCSHFPNNGIVQILEEASLHKPLDIQCIQCKVVHIHANN